MAKGDGVAYPFCKLCETNHRGIEHDYSKFGKPKRLIQPVPLALPAPPKAAAQPSPAAPKRDKPKKRKKAKRAKKSPVPPVTAP